MGKAVFFNLPGATGHINPSLGLVGELVGRGEQVIYYAGQDSADKLRALGAQPRTYQPYFDYHHNAGQATDVVEMSLIMLDLLERCVYGLREDLAKDRPDYIIYDSCCPWGKYIARALGVPAICSVTTFVPTPAAVFSDWRLGSLVARTLALGVPLVMRARRQLLDMLERLGLPYEGLFPPPVRSVQERRRSEPGLSVPPVSGLRCLLSGALQVRRRLRARWPRRR